MNGNRPLGRGLKALFGEDPAGDVSVGVRTVPTAMLVSSPLQPRRRFDGDALEELARSIREKGVLQPLIVRPGMSGNFEIVAGERRWRAAQRAQVHEIAVVVRDLSDEEALAVALIENIQRDDLSAIEEAQAYSRLAQEFGKTQHEVAIVVGKSRSHVANTTRLLELPEEVQTMLAEGKLTAGHARALVGAPDAAALAQRIAAEGLSVRAAERLRKPGKGRGRRPAVENADTLALERSLSNALGIKTKISFDGNGGTVTLAYESLEQLDDLVKRLRAAPKPPAPGVY